MEGHKKSKIERLKERLYSPKSKPLDLKPRADIYNDDHQVGDSWKPDAPMPVKKHKSLLGNSMFRKFFLGAILFFIVAIGFGAVMFFNGNNTVSANNIDINILGNAFVSGGEELPLKIELINRNNVPLQFADLIIDYKQGSGSDDKIQSDRETVGMIPAGGKVEKVVTITLFGAQGTTRDVKVTLEYRVPGSNSIFVKEKPYIVNISSTPVNLLIDGPSVTNTNQNIGFSIKTSLNTENSVKDMLVVVNYPPGFDYKSATPEPSFGDNIWALGDLSKGAEKTISIQGVIVADSGEQRAFNIYTGSADPEDEQRIGTQFNSEDYIIAVDKPFIDVKFTANGTEAAEVTSAPGQVSDGEIVIRNTTDTKMTDVELTAKFSGNAFDPVNVQVGNGFYDSTNQKIIWNKETEPVLASLEPGDTKTIKFKWRPLSFANSGIKNGETNVSLSVRARQPSLGNRFQEINDLLKKKIKYNTSLSINGYSLYNSGPFTNTGPIPPTPGAPTTYTIALSVTNTTNKVTDAKVRAKLPLYVDWMGKISPSDGTLNYNSSTRELTWDVGTVEAYTGLAGAPKQVYFQVKLTPSTSQVRSSPKLLNDITLSAKDSFTAVDIGKSMNPIDTRLNSDTNYNAQNDIVK